MSAEDKWMSTPWRAPGTAPVLDACGMAGGTPARSHSGAQISPTKWFKQGDLGSKKLPELRVRAWDSSDFFDNHAAPVIVTRDGLVLKHCVKGMKGQALVSAKNVCMTRPSGFTAVRVAELAIQIAQRRRRQCPITPAQAQREHQQNAQSHDPELAIVRHRQVQRVAI